MITIWKFNFSRGDVARKGITKGYVPYTNGFLCWSFLTATTNKNSKITLFSEIHIIISYNWPDWIWPNGAVLINPHPTLYPPSGYTMDAVPFSSGHASTPSFQVAGGKR